MGREGLAGSFLEAVIEFLKPVFSHWGYLIVFVGVLLESFFLTSWAAPGTVILLLGGFYSAGGHLNPFLVGLVAFGAALLGDLLGFYLGTRGGHRLLKRYKDNRRVGDNIARSEAYFRRFGGRTLLFGKWVAGIKAFIPIMAGVGSMPVGKFMIYTLIGNLLWTGGVFTAGYFFGENWHYIDRALNYLGWGLLVIVSAVALLVVLLRRRAHTEGEQDPQAVPDDTRVEPGGED